MILISFAIVLEQQCQASQTMWEGRGKREEINNKDE